MLIKVTSAIEAFITDRETRMNEGHESPWAHEAIDLDEMLELETGVDIDTVQVNSNDVIRDIPNSFKLGKVRIVSRLTDEETASMRKLM